MDTRLLPFALLSGLCLSATTCRAGIFSGPFLNPANGHDYYLLTPNTWTASEAEAVTLGGHLVTVNDSAENAWVTSTFTGAFYLWTGLNDAAQEGNFVWSSGQPFSYANWWPGEPNDFDGGEDYVQIYNFSQGAFQWNDSKDVSAFGPFPFQGVVEISAVPEPAEYAAVAGLALVAFGAWRRSRR